MFGCVRSLPAPGIKLSASGNEDTEEGATVEGTC